MGLENSNLTIFVTIYTIEINGIVPAIYGNFCGQFYKDSTMSDYDWKMGNFLVSATLES